MDYPLPGSAYPPMGSANPPTGSAGAAFPAAAGAYPPANGAYPPVGGTYPPAGDAYPPVGGAYSQNFSAQGGGFPLPQVSVNPAPQAGGYPAGSTIPPTSQAGVPPPTAAGPAAHVGPTDQLIAAWQPQEGMMYKGTDVANDDLSEDHGGEEPTGQPLGPPPAYTGYEGASYDTAYQPPPPALHLDPVSQTPEVAMKEFEGDSTITDNGARAQLTAFVKAHTCWGDAPAKDMKFEGITPMPALHYTLESFTEARVTQYETEPYCGGPVDGPQNGQPPAPWDIPIQAPNHFSPVTLKTEVPHTATVVGCNKCFAQGFIRCHRCQGRGMNRCGHCHGSGRRTRTVHRNGEHHRVTESCFSCHGSGRKRCYTCHGSGMVKCNKCDGYRMLKSAIHLTTTFAIESDDYTYERTDLPDELIKGVSGKTVFEQSAPRVGAIVGYKINEINQNSGALVQKHATAFPTKRLLYQRQQLRAVPVTQIDGIWKDVKFTFWIYGDEKKVYFPDYPNQCCWNCSII